MLNQKIEAICRKIAVDNVNKNTDGETETKQKLVVNGDWDTLTH